MREIAGRLTAAQKRNGQPTRRYWLAAPDERQTARRAPPGDGTGIRRSTVFPDAPAAAACACEWIARHQISTGHCAGHNEPATSPRVAVEQASRLSRVER